MRSTYAVYGVGNAIMDTEVQVADQLVAAAGLRKGTTALAPLEEQQRLLGNLSGYQQVRAAGGSVANTMVGVAQLGGAAFYVGKVGNDVAGALYRQCMREAGVGFDVEGAIGPTGTCLVLVTPDGERTMQTSLASSSALEPGDIRPGPITQSQIVYVEGYLWGAPSTTAAAERVMGLARSASVQVAISLSDPAIISSARDAIRSATRDFASIVFCNEQEAQAYAGTGDRMEALRHVAEDCPLVFMTCGKDGSIIWDGGQATAVAGYEVPVVDTTGAGDAYAAGVIYGLTHELSLSEAGTLGSFVSARVVTELGPRLHDSLVGRVPDILGGAHPLGQG